MAPAESARGLSIAAGLFIDGVPESLALGLTIAEGELGLALLVGILVGRSRLVATVTVGGFVCGYLLS